jgi:hypothetical protein
MYLTFWVRAPLKTVVIMCIYIYIYRVYRCRERERGKKKNRTPKTVGQEDARDNSQNQENIVYKCYGYEC